MRDGVPEPGDEVEDEDGRKVRVLDVEDQGGGRWRLLVWGGRRPFLWWQGPTRPFR